MRSTIDFTWLVSSSRDLRFSSPGVVLFITVGFKPLKIERLGL